MRLRERWRATWAALELPTPREAVFRDLIRRYREPQRAYHTLGHIRECFGQFDAASRSVRRPGEVLLAIWYHDAVYRPDRPHNEERSADLARHVALAAGASRPVAGRIRRLVLATRHSRRPPPGDAALLVDIDLAILGAAPRRFARYEADIQREYARVPLELFRRTRAAILERFLARDSIYSTHSFIRRLEAPARANLRRSIARLRSR
jgi:predicted metal-dependent HD superfamily phosphohydrolase